MSPAAGADADARQPLLGDAVIALRAPTQVWSRASGDLGEGAIDGVFHADTRFVRAMSLTCDGATPEWISVADDGPSRVVFGGLLRHLDDPMPDPRVRLLRERVVGDGTMRESLTIRSGVDFAIRTRLEVRIIPEFASLGEVKTGLPRTHPVEFAPDAADSVSVRHDGRQVVVRAADADVSVDGDSIVVAWVVGVEPGESVSREITMDLSDPKAVVCGVGDRAGWAPAVTSGDSRVHTWLHRALGDLDALRLALPEHPDDSFFAAGAPWFFTLFGRDSLWAARMMLPIDTAPAAATLRVLARMQGTESDPATAQQPGKILHELRSAPLAIPGEGVILPPVYYGTVDATPLWVCLLTEAWEAGMPEVQVRELLPALRGCLDWIVEHGDSDGDGFLDYRDETGHGLANQGWKDSGDSIQWRDGSLAEGPIALCEVQGYAYEAAVGDARLLEALGEPGAERLRDWADSLRERFARAFWVETPEGRYPAVALDADKRPVDTLTSNIGHLLATGILDPDDEAHIAGLLTQPSMLSGFGVRTMSTAAAGYWPLSYHGGSVWAHDTAIVARGMARAGLADHATLVAQNLLAAAEGFRYRMPELHSGDPASETTVPTPYPAACRPQAWSAAAAVVAAQITGALV